MRVTRQSRLRLRIDNVVFVALLLTVLVLLGWLSTRYHLQADWTAGGRNTLSAASQSLLQRLEGPLRITAYATEDQVLRGRIADLLERYRRHKPDLSMEFVNPDTAPDRVRELGITVDGELILEYRGRTEHLQTHSEQALTNALQRVARSGERHVVFTTGHGERDPLGQANHDLGDWGRQLRNRGLLVNSVSLAQAGAVPANTSVLVVAGPRVPFLPGEVEILRGYLEKGGNLLWLLDPGPLQGLDPIAQQLGIEQVPGVLVDPTTQIFGIERPDFVLVTRYPFHPVTRDFDLLTLFPQTQALKVHPPEPWHAEPLLTSAENAWSETGELAGEIRLDPGSDTSGPLDLGLALTRELAETDRPAAEGQDRQSQRVVVIGDGDFLSNTYLGNGGNLDLGVSLVNWLASDDALIAIPVQTAPDLSLTLTRGQLLAIGLGFLLGMPLLLLGSGLAIWWRRRRR